ncbi:hypothetical protein ElyMa_001400200 [Elysia marginata]|uniref:Secreted protein n=1 Tax=Elysia marginata TaxID=1093978 RepID=A0AAV4IWF8_9GAST|nr:hypothetical protein ElyMa_001400200 [Elysia marginata]
MPSVHVAAVVVVAVAAVVVVAVAAAALVPVLVAGFMTFVEENNHDVAPSPNAKRRVVELVGCLNFERPSQLRGYIGDGAGDN